MADGPPPEVLPQAQRSGKGPQGGVWAVTLEVPKDAGAAFAAAVAELAETFSWFDSAGGAAWRFELLAPARPDRAAFETRLALAAAAAGVARPVLVIARLPDRDWLAENRGQFPPLSVGRFFIHGACFQGRVPAGRIGLALDAGLAFGSGTHESTRGCLLAIDRLARGRRFRKPLDLGCGSGILALAIARRWGVPTVAADVDPTAVAVARANARRNGVTRLVRPVVSDGLRARALRRSGPYDLIVANILARPLARLAPQMARLSARRGVVVLSGILAEQAAGVAAAYCAEGLIVRRRIQLGPWSTLVLGWRAACDKL
jgi:ribosomal protein L11 methyltransferase